jgi:RNA-dependent RNA polymerase
LLTDHKRECQAWFIAETEGFTAEGVRQWMGDFTSEKIVAKHASRLGLCFSSSRMVEEVEIEMIDDIRHGKQYVYRGSLNLSDGILCCSLYTDGVGMISKELATKCSGILGVPEFTPAAVQIRVAG